MAVERLKRRPEFLRVAAARRKWAAPGLILQAAPAVRPPDPGSRPLESRSLDSGLLGDSAPVPDAPPAEAASPPGLRVGFTCSRKVGNAVERNRAKRRLRAAAELVMPAHALPGRDYVLIGRRETGERPFDLLLQDLRTALKRLGAFRDAPSAGDGA